MKIILNGQAKEIAAASNLKHIIEQFCQDANHVIAELNGEIVRKQHWDGQSIKDGDRLELVNFVGGG
ncbi:MAG: sulfur carrier protein ThiS [Candidatus Omnitrophota bacterium]